MTIENMNDSQLSPAPYNGPSRDLRFAVRGPSLAPKLIHISESAGMESFKFIPQQEVLHVPVFRKLSMVQVRRIGIVKDEANKFQMQFVNRVADLRYSESMFFKVE